jgi:hypothetical protein
MESAFLWKIFLLKYARIVVNLLSAGKPRRRFDAWYMAKLNLSVR